MNDLFGLEFAPSGPKAGHHPTPKIARPTVGQAAPARSTIAAAGSGTPTARLRNGLSPSTAPADSFAGLVPLQSTDEQRTLSLQERQRRLDEQKKSQLERLQGSGGAQLPEHRFWTSLATSEHRPPGAAAVTGDDDLLAAFNSSAPVSTASHFPPTTDTTSTSTIARDTTSRTADRPSHGSLGDDDDPFGLQDIGASPKEATILHRQQSAADDEDVLGLLAKPASEFERQRKPADVGISARTAATLAPSRDPKMAAVATLTDMGFPEVKARRALAQTADGLDVKEAISLLLSNAHEESQQQQSRSQPSRRTSPPPRASSGSDVAYKRGDHAVPAWMREQATQEREVGGKSPGAEKNVSQYASQVRSNLAKSANVLWKTGQKKVQKAVAEFQQESDTSQPKWMREPSRSSTPVQTGEGVEDPKRRERPDAKSGEPAIAVGMTDEALLLESGTGRPISQLQSREPSKTRAGSKEADLGSRERAKPTLRVDRADIGSVSASSSRGASRPSSASPARLSRFKVDEESETAYVSPARRKATSSIPAGQASRAQSTALGSVSNSEDRTSRNDSSHSKLQPRAIPPATSQPLRSPAPARKILHTSPTSLAQFASFKSRGTEAFRRGDYAAAHTCYSSALSQLPADHPLNIVLYCNRSLTSLRVGVAKDAVADADAALALIGPARGRDESIPLGGSEGEKPMKEFYGKSLMRKAEALEALERWADAGNVWREAVEAGHGGPVSIQGRDRCERAVNPAGQKPSAAAPTSARRPAPTRLPAAKARAARGQVISASAEAVGKLRAANAAAERADDEKFALTDQVDAQLAVWKGTKADNLRALLGSLDRVLWPEAGWKKIGMADLVIAGKVKIVYMKAIAKVHPDKISPTASVEQRMISAAVFSTLNDAWEKFKTDNGL